MSRKRLTADQLAERQRIEREQMEQIRVVQREDWERRKAEMPPYLSEHYEQYEDGARELRERLDQGWEEAERAYHGGVFARLRYRFRRD